MSRRIHFLSAAGGFEANTSANVVTSGPVLTRPFQSLAVNATCPASAAAIQAFIRIPQAGVAENDWAQVAITAGSTTKDGAGRPFTARSDYIDKAEVTEYLAAAPGHTGQFPLVVACRTAAGVGVGVFRTIVTIAGTSTADMTWSIPAAAYPGGGTSQTATATTLTGTGQGADLLLSAAVTPAAAAGQVTFKEGATTLGTAAVSGGVATFTVTAPALTNHTYTAEFVPTDAAAYGASQGTATIAVGVNATGQIVVTIPAAPVVDGALTFSVPFDTPVALAGARDSANTRITAAGAFPTVTVTDTRRDGLLGAWEVNAQATDFTGTGATIGAKYLGWTPSTSYVADAGSPLVTQAGGVVASYLDSTASAGLASSALLGKSATPGRGVATLNAGLALAIPANTSQGTYTSTVTVTLISN